MIDSLPYLVASALAVLPPSLHQEVINSLCFYILPFTISKYSGNGMNTEKVLFKAIIIF